MHMTNMIRAVGAGFVLTLAAAAPPAAQAEPRALTPVQQLTLEAARKAADGALAACRDKGATVAVSVVDRAGLPLVMLRDPLAGMHTPETATRKAWTAVSFKNATGELEKATRASGDSGGIRHLPGVAMIGGGVLLRAAGSIVGAVGVSGAPGGDLDETCAQAGADAIVDMLEFN